MLFPEKYFPDLFFFWGGGQPPLPPAPVSYAVVGYDVVTTHGDWSGERDTRFRTVVQLLPQLRSIQYGSHILQWVCRVQKWPRNKTERPEYTRPINLHHSILTRRSIWRVRRCIWQNWPIKTDSAGIQLRIMRRRCNLNCWVDWTAGGRPISNSLNVIRTRTPLEVWWPYSTVTHCTWYM